MAFCTKGLAAVKNVLHHITDELEKVIEVVTTITGKIKDLESNPTIELILSIIPGGTIAEGWFNTAIDELTGVANTALSVAEKIQTWLDTLATVPEKNAGVFKLASLATKAGDEATDATKTESFYDSAVQLHIMSNKDA